MNKGLKIKIEKVVVNSGIGRLTQQANFSDKILPDVIKEFAEITGQKPELREAKKSIAGFKIREGMTVGLKATLRGSRMEAFLQKLIHVVLPRVRDFRGLDKKAVDEHGNLTIGVKENIVFPEISAEISRVSFGMEITIVPKLQKRESALEIYAEMGVPFKK